MRLVRAERGHLDRGALDRLRDRDRHLHLEVVAAPLEDRGLRHAGDHVHVALRAAARSGLALALQPHPRPVAHPGRDVHRVLLHLTSLARAVTGGAGVLDLGAGSAALAAWLRDREEALRLRLDAASLAAAADRRGRSGLRSGAPAGGTGSRERHGHGDLAALHRLLERHVHVGLEIAPSLRPRRAPGCGAAEEVGEDVAEAAEAATGASARDRRSRRPGSRRRRCRRRSRTACASRGRTGSRTRPGPP